MIRFSLSGKRYLIRYFPPACWRRVFGPVYVAWPWQKAMEESALLEFKEQRDAQKFIDDAVETLRSKGFGVVGDGTVYGNGVWLNTLRVRRSDDNSPA